MLVTRFIPLNPSDLEEWMADPEEWVNLEEKENDQWQFELRVGLHSWVGYRIDLVSLSIVALWGACSHDIGQPMRNLRKTITRSHLAPSSGCVLLDIRLY